MSLCAKPLVCDTPLRVTRSLRSPEIYSLTKTKPSCVRYSVRRRLISNLLTFRIVCEVGLDFYERAERASNDSNFQAIHIPYIALYMFPVIAEFCQRFRTSRCTVLCGNITIYVKLLIKCKLLSLLEYDKDIRLFGLVRRFQCPYVPNRWFVTHLYASLARCARSKTIA